MRWTTMEDRQPRLAELGRQRLVAPGVVLVGTVRADGTPRISPVEPFLMEGDLWLSMMWQSRMTTDLARDPRVLVHGIITGRNGAEGEYKVRGIARAENDVAVQHGNAAAVAHVIRYDDAAGGQFVTR
jgi:Pyridoxamine 5'-phosphate oxidase